MVLTLGVTACMAGFYNGLAGNRRWGWLFFLGLAIGLLAKGPVATVLSMLPITVYMIWRGNWKDLLRLPWIGGLALVAVLVLPWYASAEIVAPGYLRYFIFSEHIQRFFEPGWSGGLYGAGPAHPKGMIWLFWILSTLPWSPLLPILIWRLRKGMPDEMPGDTGLYIYLLLFALAPLVLFTPVANTIFTNVLPGVPAAALLAVILWLRSGPAQPKWVHLGVAEVVVAAAGITLVSVLGLSRSAIPSEVVLIEAFQGPGRLAILGERSFSAEFYTDGKITRLSTLDDLGGWLAPGDGVMVPKYRQNEFVARFGGAVTPVAESRKYLLYIPSS
jgi:4-amino-4-deoxy-L-arabinose transferase-like glycosyltransferase